MNKVQYKNRSQYVHKDISENKAKPLVIVTDYTPHYKPSELKSALTKH